MKLRILTALCAFLLLLACKKDAPVEQSFKNLLTSVGSWKISQFVNPLDSSNYIGHVLVFKEDGTMVINNNTSSVKGTWGAYSYDNDPLAMFLFMKIEGHAFVNISETTWQIISHTPAQVELRAGYILDIRLTLVKNS